MAWMAGLRAGRVVKAHEACGDRGGPTMVGNAGVLGALQCCSPGCPACEGSWGGGVRSQEQTTQGR